MNKIILNRDAKFDIQLGAALRHEKRLADLLANAKIELKSESWQWEQTGNIAIEYACDGQPSGLAATEADLWFHELLRDGETIGYFVFPVSRLKELAREAYREGRYRTGGGDNGRFDNVILSIRELLGHLK